VYPLAASRGIALAITAIGSDEIKVIVGGEALA